MPFSIIMSKRTVILLIGIIFCTSIPSCFGTKIYLKPILGHHNPKTLVSLGKLEKTMPEKRIASMIFPLLMYETKYKESKKISRPPHCALNRVLRGHFPRNQDATVKLKSELISIKF